MHMQNPTNHNITKRLNTIVWHENTTHQLVLMAVSLQNIICTKQIEVGLMNLSSLQSRTQSQRSPQSAVVVARSDSGEWNLNLRNVGFQLLFVTGTANQKIQKKNPFPQSLTWRQLTADQGDCGFWVRDLSSLLSKNLSISSIQDAF